jgi:DnaK suppressor protein
MNQQDISKFKSLFLQQRKDLVINTNVISREFQVQKDDLLDDADLTSSELEASMRMRLKSREALFIKKIDQALARIQQGTFGECERCEEQIEMRRLEARPTATLCVNCKEDEEKREHLHIDGHQSKSLGRKLRLA